MKINWLCALGLAAFFAGCDRRDETGNREDRSLSETRPLSDTTNRLRSEMTTTNAATAADNTARNVRDRAGETLTPLDQSETEADRGITQNIRKALTADDSLSITAKNIKIITVNGVVTLRGPVNSDQERETIVEKARAVAGVQSVVNQLEVKQPDSAK